LDTDVESMPYAAFWITARKPTKRGDAAIDTLPFAVDEVKRRSDALQPRSPLIFDRTRASVKALAVAPDTLGDAIISLRKRMDPYTNALRALRTGVRVLLVIADRNVVGPWQTRLCPDTISWLSRIDASLMFAVDCAAPAGTETGALCAFCGIARPLADDEAFDDLLSWTGSHLGIADARLVARSLDPWAAEAIAKNNWWFLFQPREGLTLLVKETQQIDKYRGGAVAVSLLMDELRANRSVRRALRAGNPSAIDIRVRHWTNSFRSGALLRRQDVRRMADLGAAFSYDLVPDLKPQFAEDGHCVHCDYVQPWNMSANSTPGSAQGC